MDVLSVIQPTRAVIESITLHHGTNVLNLLPICCANSVCCRPVNKDILESSKFGKESVGLHKNMSWFEWFHVALTLMSDALACRWIAHWDVHTNGAEQASLSDYKPLSSDKWCNVMKEVKRVVVCYMCREFKDYLGNITETELESLLFQDNTGGVVVLTGQFLNEFRDLAAVFVAGENLWVNVCIDI